MKFVTLSCALYKKSLGGKTGHQVDNGQFAPLELFKISVENGEKISSGSGNGLKIHYQFRVNWRQLKGLRFKLAKQLVFLCSVLSSGKEINFGSNGFQK